MVKPIIKPTDEYEDIIKGPWKKLLESSDAIVTTHTAGFINDTKVYHVNSVTAWMRNEDLKGAETGEGEE